jgi:hypothetical protein
MRSLWLAGATSVCLIACTVSPADESSVTQHAESENRLASNRLASNRLASNRLASNRLASNRLASNRLASNALTAEILETEAGRDVYSYIIGCALPDGVTIEADVPGAEDTPADSPFTCVDERCTFYGILGLAPKWIDRRLNRKEQGWVSACLFARVNAIDAAELVSMRGRHEGLAVSASEAAQYTLEEGAFYGNLFIDDPDENVLPDWFACRGEDKAATPNLGGLAARKCAEEDPSNPGYTYCGFYFTGDCADFSPESASPYACRTFDPWQGVYGDCHDEPGNGTWPEAKKYRQVITVYTHH